MPLIFWGYNFSLQKISLLKWRKLVDIPRKIRYDEHYQNFVALKR